MKEELSRIVNGCPNREAFIANIDRTIVDVFPEFYLQLFVAGSFTEGEIKQLYETVKSTGWKDKLNVLSELDADYSVVIKNRIAKCSVLAFQIRSKIPNMKAMAISCVVRDLLKGPFYNFIRCDNPVTYYNDIKTLASNQKNFVILAAVSTLSIKDLMFTFYSKIESIINGISNEHLDCIKESVKTGFLDDYSNYSELHDTMLLCQQMGIYDLNFSRNLRETIRSLTRKDILDECMSGVSPIYIRSVDADVPEDLLIKKLLQNIFNYDCRI